MESAARAIKSAMAAELPLPDGRRERSLANRRKIINATVDLVAAGDPNPSAASVAAKAGVGLRSVFRHFQDKDSMLREIDDLLVKAYRPILAAPYKGKRWHQQLFELIERRCAVNECVVVFRLSSVLARYRSPFAVEKSRELHTGEKRMLDDVLPRNLQTSTKFGRSIMVATSFDTWRLLRQDERLPPDCTVRTIKDMVTGILASAERGQ
ncbi:MAG: TetR/AcrR family transcriptional regulator [Pseudomonadota bacterium]